MNIHTRPDAQSHSRRLAVKTGSKAGWDPEQHNARRLVVKTGSKAGWDGWEPEQHNARRLVVKTATQSGTWNPQHSAVRLTIHARAPRSIVDPIHCS